MLKTRRQRSFWARIKLSMIISKDRSPMISQIIWPDQFLFLLNWLGVSFDIKLTKRWSFVQVFTWTLLVLSFLPFSVKPQSFTFVWKPCVILCYSVALSCDGEIEYTLYSKTCQQQNTFFLHFFDFFYRYALCILHCAFENWNTTGWSSRCNILPNLWWFR